MVMNNSNLSVFPAKQKSDFLVNSIAGKSGNVKPFDHLGNGAGFFASSFHDTLAFSFSSVRY
jgi:hypothetical protein